MSGGVVGLIANPAAGKDIRRLVSAASPVSDASKVGIIRRAAIGAVEGGASRLLMADDRHALARRAVARSGLPAEIVEGPLLSSGRDSERAARRMAEAGVGALIVLGGDGTHRDVAKGWRTAPIVALSTGTNNVFPRFHEATVAGHAAGLVASGAVPVDAVAWSTKVIDVEIDGADGPELGLVDVALTTSSFTGSRAVWDVASLRELVTAIAEPAAVGLSAIAAALAPTDRRDPGGVHVRFGSAVDPGRDGTAGRRVRCPIAPGLYAEVTVAAHRRLETGDVVELHGPGALSFDGERDVVLGSGVVARARVSVDGLRVIDVERALAVGSAGARPPCHRSSARTPPSRGDGEGRRRWPRSS